MIPEVDGPYFGTDDLKERVYYKMSHNKPGIRMRRTRKYLTGNNKTTGAQRNQPEGLR